MQITSNIDQQGRNQTDPFVSAASSILYLVSSICILSRASDL